MRGHAHLDAFIYMYTSEFSLTQYSYLLGIASSFGARLDSELSPLLQTPIYYFL